MKLQFDLHMHSNYSKDSKMKIESILKKAKKRGLDGIAITDHEEFKGAIKAEKISKDIIIIKGEEIKTEIGDIIGLFLTEEIKTREFDKVIKEIKKQKAIAVLPHPAMGHIITDKVIRGVDAIEVFNSRTGKSANQMALNLAKKYKKIPLGGSDAHTLFEIGYGQTIIESKDKSKKEIKKALLQGKTTVRGKRPNLSKRGIIKMLKFWRENVN